MESACTHSCASRGDSASRSRERSLNRTWPSRVRSAFLTMRVIAYSDLPAAATWKPVSAAVMVTLSAPKADVSDRFARAMAKIDDVQQCHVVTGDFDFLLIIKAPSIEEYHEFAQSVLGTSTDVQSYKTTFILKTIKNADTVPEFCISAAGA